MKKTEKKKKEKQLNLGLRNTPKNTYYKYKDKYDIWLAGLETKKFIKDIFTWFVLILSISFIGTEVYMIQTIGSIPTEIPIFNYFIAPERKLATDFWIYVYPVIGSVITVAGLLFGNFFYHKERDLSKALLLTILLANFSLCLIFLKLVYSF